MTSGSSIWPAACWMSARSGSCWAARSASRRPVWRRWPSVSGRCCRRDWPVIIKPSKQGSSVGLTLVKKAQDLGNAVQLAARYDDEVMAEQFIPGIELTVGVLGDVPLPVGQIVPKHEVFDYETKYTPGMSEETFPARIDTALARQLQEYAVMAHRALKLSGYSRIDFRVSPEGDIFCLEANSLPGMTRTSLFPQAAQAAGIPFPELCERIASLARNNRTGKGG